MSTVSRFLHSVILFIRSHLHRRNNQPARSHAHTGRGRFVLAITMLAILVLCTDGIVKAQWQPHADTLLDAWKLAERAETYRFTSQVTQKMIPAAQLVNVGRPVDEEHLTVQGSIYCAADRLDLRCGTMRPPPSTRRRQSNFASSKACAGTCPGDEWTDIDDFAGDTFAPGGDVAAYLLAARHVTYLGTERREPGPL